jgi:cell shape-determining protein MreC
MNQIELFQIIHDLRQNDEEICLALNKMLHHIIALKQENQELRQMINSQNNLSYSFHNQKRF